MDGEPSAKFLVIFRRQPAKANAAVRIQTMVGTHFKYHGQATSGGADSPVTHVELVFFVKCGGQQDACAWRAFATFVKDPVVGSNQRPVCSCSPGTVHTLSIGAMDAKSYCIRAVIDRAFADYGCYQVEVSVDVYRYLFKTMCDYVRWSHEATHRRYNELVRDRPDLVIPESRMHIYHVEVEQALNQAIQDDKGYASIKGMLLGCLSQPCTPPRSIYNKTGMYWNLMPWFCFPRFGITSDEIHEIIESDPYPPRRKPLRKRPVFCSELVWTMLMLAQLPMPETMEPYSSTPFDVEAALAKIALVPAQSVERTGFKVVVSAPLAPVVPPRAV